MSVFYFIESCKIVLRNGKSDVHIIDGKPTKCVVYDDDKIEIVKSLVDYTLLIKNKKDNNVVVSLDREGYIGIVKKEWKDLEFHISNL